jgi:hypothetical protein
LDGGTAEEVDGAAASTELLEAPKRKGDHRSEKAAMALKSHSEAERRRRERINAHLATLRTMVPCTDKVSSSSSSRHPSCSYLSRHMDALGAGRCTGGSGCRLPAGEG